MGTGYEAGASFPEHADLAGTGIEAAVGANDAPPRKVLFEKKIVKKEQNQPLHVYPTNY